MEEREERQETRKPKRKRLGKVKAVILLILAIVLAVTLIANRDRLTLSHLTRAIQYSGLGSDRLAEEFRFPNVGSNTFATLGDGLALASSGGLRVYDRTASLVYMENVQMDNPVIQTAGDFVLAYDLGGFSLRSGNRREALAYRDNLEGRIIDARINANGWVTLSTERVGTLGEVTVIDPQGNGRYRVGINSGHVIAALLGEDNRTLIVLTMADTGGRVLWFDIHVEGQSVETHQYLREGELFFDIWVTSRDGGIGLISNNMVLYLSPRGAVEHEYHFRERHLRAYNIADGRIALYFEAGIDGEIILLQANGSEQRIQVGGNLIDISQSGRYVAALFPDELLIFRGTSRYARFRETEGMTRILMRTDGTVFRLSSQRAILLVP